MQSAPAKLIGGARDRLSFLGRRPGMSAGKVFGFASGQVIDYDNIVFFGQRLGKVGAYEACTTGYDEFLGRGNWNAGTLEL
jgi:hypothetical protein